MIREFAPDVGRIGREDRPGNGKGKNEARCGGRLDEPRRKQADIAVAGVVVSVRGRLLLKRSARNGGVEIGSVDRRLDDGFAPFVSERQHDLVEQDRDGERGSQPMQADHRSKWYQAPGAASSGPARLAKGRRLNFP